eukprot:1159473-Amphidinium_carterae.1
MSSRFADVRGFRAEGIEAARTERALSAAVFRFLRFVTEAAMLGHGVIHGSANFGGDLAAAEVFEQLNNEVQSLKEHLFAASADATPARLFLHSLTARFLGTPLVGCASWPLNTEQAREAYEAAVSAHLQPQASQHVQVVRAVQDDMDELHASSMRNETIEAIKCSAWFKNQSSGHGLSSPCSLHWMPIDLLSLERFWAAVDSCHARMPVVHLLHQREVGRTAQSDTCVPQLALLRHLPVVATFLRLVYASFHLKVSRAEATVLTLKDA